MQPPGGCQPSLGSAALTRVSPSRVHITEATLNHLDKAYEVEDGHGQQRDPYLKEMNIRTYLVIDPRVRGLRGRRRAGWAEGTLGGPGPGARPHRRGEFSSSTRLLRNRSDDSADLGRRKGWSA